jgi:hypothetical protein
MVQLNYDPEATQGWSFVKQTLGSPGFLNSLLLYPKDALNPDAFKLVDEFLQGKTAADAKSKSAALEGLFRWLGAIHSYQAAGYSLQI